MKKKEKKEANSKKPGTVYPSGQSNIDFFNVGKKQILLLCFSNTYESFVEKILDTAAFLSRQGSNSNPKLQHNYENCLSETQHS